MSYQHYSQYFKVAATAKTCGKVSHAAESRLTGTVSVVRTLEQFSFQAATKNVQ